MLEITIDPGEIFDNEKLEFISIKPRTIQMEHSLVSISKWEAKWHKSYLTTKDKTYDEMIDYFHCMTITQNVDPSIFRFMSKQNVADIEAYINDSMTATHINRDTSSHGPKDTMTSEVIYYYMIASQIPFECQKWHLNRLLTLIEVCGVKNSPPKKMSPSELASRNKKLNAARRQHLNSKG